jgi:hypothetical protein
MRLKSGALMFVGIVIMIVTAALLLTWISYLIWPVTN